MKLPLWQIERRLQSLNLGRTVSLSLSNWAFKSCAIKTESNSKSFSATQNYCGVFQGCFSKCKCTTVIPHLHQSLILCNGSENTRIFHLTVVELNQNLNLYPNNSQLLKHPLGRWCQNGHCYILRGQGSCQRSLGKGTMVLLPHVKHPLSQWVHSDLHQPFSQHRIKKLISASMVLDSEDG